MRSDIKFFFTAGTCMLLGKGQPLTGLMGSCWSPWVCYIIDLCVLLHHYTTTTGSCIPVNLKNQQKVILVNRKVSNFLLFINAYLN